MKRKDWKIKKLKKNIYDKFYKRKRIFFLRKLNLKKNLVFLKKNYISNFIYFKNFFKKKLYNINNKNINLNYDNKFLVLPEYIFKKKVFLDYINFNKNIKNVKLNHLFLTKNNNLISKNLKGNNIIIYNKNVSEKKQNNFYLDENLNSVFSLKYEFNRINCDLYFNFFFNSNVYIFNVLEIYKIIILLNIVKLK